MVSSSMKFKFIHKMSVIHEKFLVFFNLLRGPDKTPLGAGSCPQVVHPCYIGSSLVIKIHSLLYVFLDFVPLSLVAALSIFFIMGVAVSIACYIRFKKRVSSMS